MGFPVMSVNNLKHTHAARSLFPPADEYPLDGGCILYVYMCVCVCIYSSVLKLCRARAQCHF